MKKKIISYGIVHIFFNLVQNILRIWHNYGVFILLVVIFGLVIDSSLEIKNFDESGTNNNDQQNEHTITVPDTQDVPNQVEENLNNSVRDHFFLHGQVAMKANQRKN